jgi:DNA adenine methylase
MKAQTEPKAKTRAILGWVGGKSLLTGSIIPLIPAHKTYVEVFAGAAWLLFRKPSSDVEIINDLNRDLTTLYRVVQHHLEEFLRYFKWVLVSREEFDRLKQLDPTHLTDIQRAARFYYLIKGGFGCRVTNPSFGIGALQKPRINLVRLEEDLSEAHLRLSRVFIDNRPYGECIDRFDKPGTFFYLDPPYWDCEDHYGKGLFSKADFTRLRDQLSTTKGKWLVSINNVAPIRELFSDFHLQEVATRYSLASQQSKPVTELLIANYPLPASTRSRTPTKPRKPT